VETVMIALYAAAAPARSGSPSPRWGEGGTNVGDGMSAAALGQVKAQRL
jgi:hypothetical protein